MFLEIGGKDRRLTFDYNAVCDIEMKAGISMLKLMDENAGFNTLRLLLWGAFKKDNAGLTLDMVGLWIMEYLREGKSLESLFDVVGKALIDSGIMGNVQMEGEK